MSSTGTLGREPAAAVAEAPSHAGARREKVGRTGRLHLDRALRFLVVHRLAGSAERSASLARRVALNAPAYLIWSEEDDAAALSLLDELSLTLGSPERPLLVIAVDDLTQAPELDDSQHLTPFVAALSGGRDKAVVRARETLRDALSAIEADTRTCLVMDRPLHAEHWLSVALREEAAITDPLLVELPQIHLRDDGGVYPRLFHDLAVACGDALLRAACAFLDEKKGDAPAHYRSLGRSAYLNAALKIDRKLDAIAGSFDFLLSVSPINTAEAMDRFISGGEQAEPEFRYRPLTVDPDAVKRDLYKLDFTRLEDSLLERLFSEKRHEVDEQLTLLNARNTPAFRPASQLLYGGVGPALLADAKRILALSRPHVPRGKAVDAPVIAGAAKKLIGRYHSAETPFDATVEIRDDVAGLMVTRNRLLVGSTSLVPAGRLEPLLAHEVSTHLLTFINGAAQGLSIFRTGLAHYEGVQEGLGVFAEWAVGGLTITRMRLLAARVVAVHAMQSGAGFIDTYRLLRNELGFTRQGAFGIAARVHRSGGLAKDFIYLEGFRTVIDHVASGASLAPYWLGKISPRDVPAIEELLHRRLVHAPRFQPDYLDRPDVSARIAKLRGGIPLDQLFAVEKV